MLGSAHLGSTEPPKVAIVLSGGSATGFAHVGVLGVLEEAGVPIKIVNGADAGH